MQFQIVSNTNLCSMAIDQEFTPSVPIRGLLANSLYKRKLKTNLKIQVKKINKLYSSVFIVISVIKKHNKTPTTISDSVVYYYSIELHFQQHKILQNYCGQSMRSTSCWGKWSSKVRTEQP